MEQKMNKLRTNIPFALLLIVTFYTFGAVVLLILLFANPVQTSSVIAGVHGLPLATGYWILPLIAVLALLIAYGLFSLSRWGYLLTIMYLGYFGSVSAFLLKTHGEMVYLGNLIWSVFVILYLVVVRKRFQPR
jgi:hypothetical protein